MNIIFEGPDGSGKSTLIRELHSRRLLTGIIKSGEGPPKYPGEMDERIERYLDLDNHIFDRHPCVSDAIYGPFRNPPSVVNLHLTTRFYDQPNVFVYCPGYKSLGESQHEASPTLDTPEHLSLIETNDTAIRHLYDIWGSMVADVTYHIGDDIIETFNKIKGGIF